MNGKLFITTSQHGISKIKLLSLSFPLIKNNLPKEQYNIINMHIKDAKPLETIPYISSSRVLSAENTFPDALYTSTANKHAARSININR
jgi:hypothetical protein